MKNTVTILKCDKCGAAITTSLQDYIDCDIKPVKLSLTRGKTEHYETDLCGECYQQLCADLQETIDSYNFTEVTT